MQPLIEIGEMRELASEAAGIRSYNLTRRSSRSSYLL
jgi:hypothetical protein